MVPHGHLKQRPAARAKRAPHVTLSPRASAARARSLKSVSVRRSRPPRYLTLVLQLPGSEILRTRQIAYTKLYTAGMIAFGLFLGLIFFTLLETSRAADFAAGDPWEDAVHAWSDAERRDLRTAFRREMLYSVEHVERLVENQKQIRLLLSTRGLSEYSELDDMETELGTLGRLRESSTRFEHGRWHCWLPSNSRIGPTIICSFGPRRACWSYVTRIDSTKTRLETKIETI